MVALSIHPAGTYKISLAAWVIVRTGHADSFNIWRPSSFRFSNASMNYVTAILPTAFVVANTG